MESLRLISAKERHQQTSNLWLLIDSKGRTIFVADAHRGDGKRFVVRADGKLTAFLELEAAIRQKIDIVYRRLAESDSR